MVWILHDPPAEPLLTFLLQLALTLCLTRLLGRLLSYIHEPPVIGEIIGGILLGPSVLGRIPGFTAFVFPTKSSLDTFTVVANMGLIFFMFIMGLEVDPKLLRHSWKRSLPIAMSAILFPFGLGMLNSLWMEDVNNDETVRDPHHVGFLLFAGTSMSFTAFPVLAALLTSLRLLHTPLGVQALACAAVDDVMAWCLLAISSSFSTKGTAIDGLYVVLLAAAFVTIMFVVTKPLVHRLHDYMLARGKEEDPFLAFLLVLVLLASAYCAEVIGIHAFLGAFVAGIIVPKKGNLAHSLVPKLELVITQVFLPLFFANSGIRTDIGSLNSASDWGYTFALIGLAVVGKMLPATLVTKWCTGNGWKFCFAIGALMNTRGLVELIALNVGLTNGILSTRMFTMLVLMAIVTTIMTAPIFYFLKLDEHDVHSIRNGMTLEELGLAHAPGGGKTDDKTDGGHGHAVEMGTVGGGGGEHAAANGHGSAHGSGSGRGSKGRSADQSEPASEGAVGRQTSSTQSSRSISASPQVTFALPDEGKSPSGGAGEQEPSSAPATLQHVGSRGSRKSGIGYISHDAPTSSAVSSEILDLDAQSPPLGSRASLNAGQVSPVLGPNSSPKVVPRLMFTPKSGASSRRTLSNAATLSRKRSSHMGASHSRNSSMERPRGEGDVLIDADRPSRVSIEPTVVSAVPSGVAENDIERGVEITVTPDPSELEVEQIAATGSFLQIASVLAQRDLIDQEEREHES